MADQFKPGDVVALKSGGPKMTVTPKRDGTRVWCDWFEGKERQGQYFEEILLKPAKAD
jgi:uncharacterized protein YodC (DUF2158 family)